MCVRLFVGKAYSITPWRWDFFLRSSPGIIILKLFTRQNRESKTQTEREIEREWERRPSVAMGLLILQLRMLCLLYKLKKFETFRLDLLYTCCISPSLSRMFVSPFLSPLSCAAAAHVCWLVFVIRDASWSLTHHKLCLWRFYVTKLFGLRKCNVII